MTPAPLKATVQGMIRLLLKPTNIYFNMVLAGVPVAQWAKRWPADLSVPGPSPT